MSAEEVLLDARYKNAKTGFGLATRAVGADSELARYYRETANELGRMLYALDNNVSLPLDDSEETLFLISKWSVR